MSHATQRFLTLAVLASLAAALLTSCASTNQDEYQDDARLVSVREDNETLKRRLVDMGSVETALERELNAKKGETRSATAESQRLRSENRRLLAELDRLKRQPKPAANTLRPNSRRGERSVSVVTPLRNRGGLTAPKINFSSLVGKDIEVVDNGDGKLRVRLAGATMFRTASSDLSKGGRKILDKVGDILRENRGVFVSVEGHTDATPLGKSRTQWGTNMALSMARALVVQDYLKNSEKISEKRMRVVGYGEHRPAQSGRSASALAKNRRVELVLTNRAP
ncbi:MAG: OmpA family protein [Planctomycetota bacterium]